MSKQLAFVVALAVLLLALVFFAWVLQLPSRQLAPVRQGPPAVGVVKVNVVGTPTPTASASAVPSASVNASASPGA